MNKRSSIASRSSIAHSSIATNTSQRVNEEDDLAFDMLDHNTVTTNITFDTIDTKLSKPKGTSKFVISKRKRLARTRGSRVLSSEETSSTNEGSAMAILKKSNNTDDTESSSIGWNSSSSATLKLDEGADTAFEDARGMKTITLVDMSPGVKLTEKQRLTLLNMACTYEDTGDMYLQVNDFEEAHDSFHQFYLISIAVFGKDGLDVANGLLKMAEAELMKTNDRNLKKIDEYFQEAFRIRAKKLGSDHKKVIDVLDRTAFLTENNMPEAADCFRKIVEIKSDLEDVDTAEIASLYAAMGECNMDLESFEEALVCFNCALTLLRKGSPDNFEHIGCYATLLFFAATANEKIGDELVAEGDSFYMTEAKEKFKDAAEYFAEAVKILRRQEILSQPDVKHALSRMDICKQKQRLIEDDSALDIFDVYLSCKSAKEGSLTVLGEQAKLERKRTIVESLKTTSKCIPYDQQVATSDAKIAKLNLDDPERAKHLENELVLFLQRGLVSFAAEDFMKAIENYKKAAAIIAFLWGDEHMELALVFEKLAEIELALLNQGKNCEHATYDRAVKYCSDALRINRVNKNSFNAMHILSKVKLLLKSMGIDGKTYEIMGNHCLRMKKYQEAIECYKHACIATKTIMGENDVHIAFLLTKMANVEALVSAPAETHSGIGQVSNCFERALKIVQNNDPGIHHIKALKVLHKASSGDIMFYRDMGYVALRHYEESLHSIDSIMGKGRHTGSSIRLNMAEIYFAKSDYERAFQFFQEGLDARSEDCLDEEYAIITHCIGLTLEKQGDILHKEGQRRESIDAYIASLKRFDEAYSIFSTILGNSHDDVINTLHHCGYLNMKLRRYDVALGMYQKELVCVRSLCVDDERLPDILKAKATAHVKKNHYDEALECLEELLDFVRKNKPGDDHLLERTLIKIAPIYGHTKNYEKAISAYSEALQIKLSQKGGIEDPRIRYKVGRLYMMSNKPGLAASLYEEALPLLTANFEKHHRDIFTTLRLLGNIYFDQGTYMFHRALGCYQCALKILKKYPEVRNSTTVESILNNMAFIFYTAGDILKAIETLKEAIKIYEANNGTFNPGYASLRHNLANVFLKIGDHEEAKVAYNEAFTVKIQLMRLVGDDTILLNPLDNMGATYVRLRDYERALECYEGMRAIRESELGKHSLQVCDIHREIALVHCHMENYGKAKASYKRVLKILVKKLGYSHEDVMDILYRLGLVLFKNEEYDAALKLYDTTMQSKTTSEAKRAVILNRIANVFMKKGEYEVALNYYQLSLDMKNKTVGNNHKSVARTLYNIGLVCHREGLIDEASDYLRAALDIDRRSPGNIHPMKIARTMVSVGKAYFIKGNFSDASSLFREVEHLLLLINIPSDDETLKRTQLYIDRCKRKMNFATGDW
eukprot:CAMPEP_0116003976 /NCGR_PEP_ID=MMETSP0321-20121206/341_1 /TAXON_ID=163516 /ORGANISM="Leptocylindrus danicus var. danicus, Strain B650" /LENGTH=1397 /DNA_ID=CAMNT_0003472217 /DNA_START=122 /DNA_END=4312 /DNA_ORIENTATION=-